MSEDKVLSFWDHLEELRWTLLKVIIALVVMCVATFVAMPYIFDDFILGPTSSDFFIYKLFGASESDLPLLPDFGDKSFAVEMININVASQFTTHINTSFWLALVLVFPFFIYQIWSFIRPALYAKEIANVRLAFSLGTLMFYIGCSLSYCIIFPFTFRFLVEYRVSDAIVNQINLNSYMSIFLMMIFIMGLIFELPLLAWVLSKLGLINKSSLSSIRKYAVVVLLALAAVITPTGDPFTLMLVFIPLYLLYEFSIFIVKK